MTEKEPEGEQKEERKERSPFDLPHYGELIPQGPYYTPESATGQPGDFDPMEFGALGGPGYTPMAQTDLEEDEEREEREKRKSQKKEAP